MKEDDIKTIWQVPKYLPYVQPTLTDEILTIAEKKIGHKLPKEYVDLLQIQNGGYIRFTLKETPNDQIYGIGPYFPSLTDFDWSDYEDAVSFTLNGLVPFDGDGHWSLCFDYREDKIEPEITFIDTECDNEESIAKNFKEYLSLLELKTEDKFVIKTNSPIEEVITSISRILKIEFEDPEYFNYGYASYRSKVKDCWIWVSPNKAPSGFIRETDKRYDELKSQMETTSIRFPEIPENYLFISASDDIVRQTLFEKLNSNEVEIVDFKTLAQ